MTRIETPVKGFSGSVAGVTFTNGAGETDDPVALGYFRRRGYTVEELAAPPFPDGDPVETWTVPQLVAWAAAHDVDLKDVTKKAEVWAVIADHNTAKTATAGEGLPPAS